MINAIHTPLDPAILHAIDYSSPAVAATIARGAVNVDDATILANIESAIRRGYPQMQPGPARDQVVALVGSGPSLADTADELRALVDDGAKIVTLNGAYSWCLEQGLRPSVQVVMDARPACARFVEPAIPACRYVLASQCDPAVFDAVAGRPHVWIFHAAYGPGAATAALDAWYGGRWWGIGGGVTVATRALMLFTLGGWSDFHLFGIDSCWLGDTHHIVAQAENDRDPFLTVTLDNGRQFRVSPWHVKQLEDFLVVIRLYGEQFRLAIHGDGLLANVLSVAAAAAEQDTPDGDTALEAL